MAYDFAGLRELALAAGVAPPNANVAAAIAMAESGGNPRAQSVTGDFGLWQINARSWPQFDRAKLLEPTYNAQAMAIVSRTGRGWDHWTVYRTGRYKKFLPDGVAAGTTSNDDGILEQIAGGVGSVPGLLPGVDDVTGAAGDAIGSVVGEAISGVATLALSLLLGATGLALAGLGLSGLARTSTTGQRTLAAGQGAAAGAAAGPGGAALGAAAGVASLT
jgi:hypothetical protein